MFCVLLFISQVFGNLLISVLLIYSSETPLNLLTEFSEYTLQYKITPQSHPSDLLELSSESELLIVDISSHPLYFSFLDSACELIGTVYLTVTYNSEQSFSKYRYFAHLKPSLEAQGLLNLTNFLGWKKFTILSSFRNSDFTIASEIKLKNTQAQINSYYYDQELTESQADFLIKRKIKAEGVSNLLIIDSGKSLKSLEKQLKQRKVLKKGFQLILSSKSIYNTDIDGALLISEIGTESSNSEPNYSYLRIKTILNQIPLKTNFKVFLKNYYQVSELCDYSIINIQDLNPKKVGSLTDSIQITEKIIFPGNSTTLNLNNKSSIILSIANGTSELYHKGFYPLSSYLYIGAGYAVTRANLNNEIENFELKLFTTDCGNTIYDSDWYLECFYSILPDMGIAYLSSFSSAVAIGNLITLRYLNYSIPQISPIIQGDYLGNKSLFPEFVTLTVSEAEYFSTVLYFLFTMRWRSIILIGSNDDLSIKLFNDLKIFLKKYKITIANPEETQIFPQNYTVDDFKKHKEKFTQIKNTLCRVYIIVSVNIAEILEGLYEIGLRKGDFIGIFHSLAMNSIKIVDKNKLKLLELLKGSFFHNLKEFVGDYGAMIKKEILNLTNDISNYCFGFDTILIIKNAILHLIALGEDYENPILLMNYIRILKHIGCMGNIQIDINSNYRSRYIIALQQFYFDEASQSLQYNEVITIDKYSQNPVHINAEFKWPGNNNLIPTNFIEMNSCGLDERLIVDSIEGRNFFLFISGFLLFFTMLFAIISARIFRNSLPQIEKNTTSGINEKYFFAFFLFEYFQINLHGNRKGVLYEVGPTVFELMGFDFISFFCYEFNPFWEFMKFIIAIQLIFCLLCCFEILIPKICYEKIYLFEKIQDLNRILLPVLGHIAFMPLISQNLNVFMCKQGISSDIKDSFVELDCKTFCYRDKHKVFGIISSVSIVLFLFFAIILRPYWEKLSLSHIKTNPIYLAILSVFQVTIILISASFSFFNPEIVGIINSSVIVIFLILTIYLKPYNYDQAFYTQILILSMNFWDILFGSIYSKYNNRIIKILQVSGTSAILVIGRVLIIRLEKIFIEEENFPISNLMKFQFRRDCVVYLKSDSQKLNVIEMGQLNYLEK